ncbi:MAG: T9SS type A sorting domain-containing protein [Rhodothermaceae bacterium]
MKKLLLLLAVMSAIISAQSFSVTTHGLAKTDTLGSEIIFDLSVKNTGSTALTLAIVREQNNLPAQWTSSLCFTSCFAPFLDTIKTTPDFGSNPVQPGDSIKVSLHVFPVTTLGTGNVQLKIINTEAVSNFKVLNFEAKAEQTTDIFETNPELESYFLSQNYPNPFNPSTKIKFGLQKEGDVKIEVFNILGQKVAVLMDEYLSAGAYTVDFKAQNLSSGVYIYRIKADQFVEIRKMILEK